MVVIIFSQYIHISNHCIVHFKNIQLFVNCSSKNLGENLWWWRGTVVKIRSRTRSWGEWLREQLGPYDWGGGSQLTEWITYTNKPFIQKDDSDGAKRLTVSQEPKLARHKDPGLSR